MQYEIVVTKIANTLPEKILNLNNYTTQCRLNTDFTDVQL